MIINLRIRVKYLLLKLLSDADYCDVRRGFVL